MALTFRVCCRSQLAMALVLGSVTIAGAADGKLPVVLQFAAVSKQAPEPEKAETKSDASPEADSAPVDKSEKKESAPAARPKAKKVKQLSAEMTERRDRVRRLIAALRQQPFNTQQNDSTDVLEFCRGFGCNTELLDNAGSGQKVNGITCLCWNMPCGGSELMTVSEGHLTGRIGYGYQSQASDLAAVLALSEVPADYPARCGRTVRTVADIIEYEKLTCRAGTDMSLKLVALAQYVREPSWKDNQGNQWTLRRVVAEELDRPVANIPHAATNRLLGLVAALNRFKADKAALDGELARAKSYVEQATLYAYSAQNTDGSWGRAYNRDYATAVSYTAHMLEWLVAALPADGLEERHIAAGIDFLTTSFNASHYQTYISTMNPREVAAAMHAAYVLNAYDQAVFAPADPLPETAPAKTEKAEPKAAERTTEAR